MELAIEFSLRLPGPFDIELARFKYPVKYYESMNSVLHQEMIRYNRLTDVSHVSLPFKNKAIMIIDNPS